MTVPELVASLEAEGFTIQEKEGSLAVRPARNVTPTMRETLTALGPEILDYLRRPRGVDWTKVSPPLPTRPDPRSRRAVV